MNPFDLAGLAKEKQELEEQMAQDGFWNDVENANKVNQRIKAIHAKLDKYRKLETTGEDVSTLFDMAEEEDDEETALEAQAELKDFLHKVEEFRIDTMLRGPYDNANAVLSLHAGAGPFDSSGRRHTSFASLDVTPILDDDAGDIEINPDDIRVDTYRSSGAGGQHVNKTSSAIRITHFPTGVVVQCQNERSQIQNRETAMRMLRGKLLEIKERERMEHMADIKGEMKKIEWGSQIRSYVFQPYTMVKDHRTGEETGNIQAVMDGDIESFINAYLMKC